MVPAMLTAGRFNFIRIAWRKVSSASGAECDYEQVKRAIHFIRANYRQQPDLDEAARQVLHLQG
jgi:hypothetical protein